MIRTNHSDAADETSPPIALDVGNDFPRCGVVVYDARGKVVDAGPSGPGLLGRTRDALMRAETGAPFLPAIREDGTPFPMNEFPSRVVERTGRPASGVGLGIRGAGGTRWLLVSAYPRPSPGGSGPPDIVVTYVDVTEQKDAERRSGRGNEAPEQHRRDVEQARRQAVEARRQTETLFEATRQIGDNETLYPALNAVVDGCRKLFGADRVAVLDQAASESGLACLASFGFSDAYLQSVTRFYNSPATVKLLFGSVEPYAMTNLNELPESRHPRVVALRAEGVQSALAVPLVRAESVSGSLIIAHEYPRTYRAEEIRAAEVLARQAAIAIEHARVEAAALEANRRLEEALRTLQRTQEHVVQQERLRALGEMASGIAHDFNNALQHVIGFCDLLLEIRPADLEDPVVVRSYLQWMRTAANDAAETVRRLRAFYRVSDDGDPATPIDLNDSIRKSISLTQPRWRDQALAHGSVIVVRTDLGVIPRIRGKEAELREALTNLIFNAVDALPNGGRITIRTREEAGNVVLGVQDTGVGMSEEVCQRCLEPFFTTKGPNGSGLGLAMVYGTVTRLGGRIDVDSQPGKGTLVRLSLPIDQSGDDDLGADTVTANGPALRVLIVDDEPGLRRILTELIESDGHRAHAVGSGQEAIETLAREPFDLVITDRAIPGWSGDALATAVKQHRSSLPVIMLTGFGELMHATGDLPPDVDLVLGKPVTIDVLRRGIAAVRAGLV